MKYLNFKSALLLIVLIACSDDESNSDNNSNDLDYESNIIGKWKVEYQWSGEPKENYEDYIGLPQTEPENTTDYTIETDETTHLFRTDGTVFTNEWGETYTKEYFVDGNQLFTDNFRDSPPGVEWHSRRIFHMTPNYFIMDKICHNNNCDNDYISVRYYRRID